MLTDDIDQLALAPPEAGVNKKEPDGRLAD